jgi:hypothetical protein
MPWPVALILLLSHLAVLQVAGKALPSSGLLSLSGLRLLWVSRKGQLLFEAAPEEPRRKAFSGSQLSKTAARFFGSKQKPQGGVKASTSLAKDTAVPQAATSGAESPHQGDHMTVTISGGSGSGGAITRADLILQVC